MDKDILAIGVTIVLLKCYMNLICLTLILYCIMVQQLLQVCVMHVRTLLSHICCVLFLKHFLKLYSNRIS